MKILDQISEKDPSTKSEKVIQEGGQGVVAPSLREHRERS